MNNNMRRGHQGIEEWRYENPRTNRQRNTGHSRFRTQRNFNQHNNRFSPLGPRHHRSHFNSYNVSNERITKDQHWIGYNQNSEYTFSRTTDQIPSQTFYPNQIEPRDNASNFIGSFNSERYSTNAMDEVNLRQTLRNRTHSIPWNNDIDEQTNINTYKENPNHYNKQHPKYAGHRPPASDHYDGNPISTNGKSNTFSRSVDDTVNIVRRRLLNRVEIPQVQSNEGLKDSVKMYQNLKVIPRSSQDDQYLIKKKAPRAIKINYERIKNKIYNQLFKMDKEKIHKLLDNPNSSTKFEYAINSLLTESQNSFNQHMRSVAEKSLCSSSKEFMQNDNNTIYEDTFLKQMQCILDPQDTVFLEDIKPVVMAELSDLLQFDEIDNRWSYHNQHNSSFENPQDSYDYTSGITCSNKSVTDNNFSTNCSNANYCEAFEDTKPLFERKVRRESATISPNSDIGHTSRSATDDNKCRSTWDGDDVKEKYNYPCDEPSKSLEHNEPLVFDANATFIEDEDTFAELDRQYHVAVNHDFTEDDELSNPVKELNTSQRESIVCTSQNNTSEINMKLSDKNEKLIVSQLQNFELNKFEPFISHDTEVSKNNNSSHDQNSKTTLIAQDNQSNNIKIKNESHEIIHPEISRPTYKSRTRSTDQRPSHRKEKRKKSEDRDNKSKTQEKIKGTQISASSSKCENIISDDLNTCRDLKQSKEKSSHSDNKKQIPCDKISSEKCITEKESLKTKPREERKRQDSTSSTHSISPKSISTLPLGSSKSDSKYSLKSIDIFTETPKKINTHQACRNTALNKTPNKIAPTPPEPALISNEKSQNKSKASHAIKNLLSKETQTVKSSVISRSSQTVKINCVTRAVQVNLDSNDEKKTTNPSDTLERMKEIDLEIQKLLQEKFKLYSSLETREGSSYIPMHNLGMTVLNVNSLDDIIADENYHTAVANSTTDSPAGGLAPLEVATEDVQSVSSERRQRRSKRKISSNLQFKNNPYEKTYKKSNPLNFSLIEQIITDERPLEDIVTLEDFETTPSKLKKKQRRIRQVPKKTTHPKKDSPIPDFIQLKECYVLLLREDLNQYIFGNPVIIKEEYCESNIPVSNESQVVKTEGQIIPKVEWSLDDESGICEVVEETVLSSDITFDMLDVSEDIVIGDVSEEKGDVKLELVPRSDEIILDNSQSREAGPASAEAQGGGCKLYDYLADDNLKRDSLVLNGNADAILALECVGTNFLAAGLDGNVYYFKSDGQLISTLRGSNLAVTCLCIVEEKYGTTVYTGSLDSRIRNYDLETGLEMGPECNVLSPIQTMDRAWDTVFVGTKTGFVLQFECKNNLLIPVSTVKFSEQSILALRAMKEGPRKVLLVAARSENVTIKDAQTGLLLRTLNGPLMTVYTLLYEDGKVYCGTSSHQIQVFDYTSGSHVGTHESGKGAICLRAAGGLLFAGCYDGCVYVYREGEPRPFAKLRGPSLMLLCLSIVGTKIIAGFKDRSLYIWKIPLSILQEMIL